MIEIRGLAKTYGTTEVLTDIDLTVGDAQIGAIVGPSGAGKSTLARCINLLEEPTRGSVVVNGRDLARLSRRDLGTARRQIGTVFQSAPLLRRLTAAQNVALPLRHAGVGDQELRHRVRELLERVDMVHRANHYPSQLSGGQRQRIGIARGLALRPSVLLSDEATSGLDPDTTRAILRLLDELRSDLGVTVLVITHEMDVVRAVADTVYQLDHGRIVEHGPVAEVMLRSDSPLSQALLPMPAATVRPGQRAWRVRYRHDAVSPTWLPELAHELHSEVAILAALVEDTGTGSVGRLTLGLDPRLTEPEVRDACARRGLVATPATESDLVATRSRAHEEPAA